MAAPLTSGRPSPAPAPPLPGSGRGAPGSSWLRARSGTLGNARERSAPACARGGGRRETGRAGRHLRAPTTRSSPGLRDSVSRAASHPGPQAAPVRGPQQGVDPAFLCDDCNLCDDEALLENSEPKTLKKTTHRTIKHNNRGIFSPKCAFLPCACVERLLCALAVWNGNANLTSTAGSVSERLPGSRCWRESPPGPRRPAAAPAG